MSIEAPKGPLRCRVRVRHRSTPAQAVVTPGSDGGAEVSGCSSSESPQAGQVDPAGAYAIMRSRGDFLLASESQDAYTDSAAVAHASQTVTAGRVSAGPRILFPEMPTSSGYYRFWAGAMGEYDFSNTSPVPSSGLPDLGDVGSLRVSGGLDSRIGEGTLSLRADIFGIGSGEFTAYGGTLGYELPF